MKVDKVDSSTGQEPVTDVTNLDETSERVYIPQKSRHEMRPVHPNCAALSNEYASCTCPLLWGYHVDLERLRDVHQRLDMRTKHGRHVNRGLGHGPDKDDFVAYGFSPSKFAVEEVDNRTGAADISDDLQATGFWKESEFLQGFVDMLTEPTEDTDN